MTLYLYPRRFDRGIPTGMPFRVRASAGGQLVGERLERSPPRPLAFALWHIPESTRRHVMPGRVGLTQGARERAAISVTCADGWLALRFAVRRALETPSEWTVAEVAHRVDPPLLRRMMDRGLEARLFDPVPYEHEGGWPIAGQLIEVRDGQAALTVGLSPRGEALFDLTARRRVLVLHAAARGWVRTALTIPQDALDVGLDPEVPWTLSVSVGVHRSRTGGYEGTFGLLDAEGTPVVCPPALRVPDGVP